MQIIMISKISVESRWIANLGEGDKAFQKSQEFSEGVI